MIKYCEECMIPILDNSECPICKSELIKVNGDMRPVFYPERLLVSLIIEEDLENSIVWSKGSNYYLVDGKNKRADYVSILKDQNKIKKIRKEFKEKFDKDRNEIYTENIVKFIKANEQHFNKIVYESESYIKDVYEKYKDKKYVPMVSFSGGKDSTATSKLVRDALGEQKILHLFGDTTLEFDLTHDYIKEFRKENKFTPLMSESSRQSFWDLCDEFGPPSRLDRWCCTIFKTGAIGKLINLIPDDSKALSFVGIRRSESKERSKYERTRYDSKIERQIVCMPIIDWKDIDVWLYILSKNILFNKAYYYGFSRVGCWNCPNNSNWSTFLEAIHMEENYTMWRDLLIDYAKKAGKPDYEVYVDEGYWKARRGLQGVESIKSNIESTECDLNDNAKMYFIDKPINMEIVELLKPFGTLEIVWKNDKEVIITIFKSGDEKLANIYIYIDKKYFKAVPLESRNPSLFLSRLECQVNKYLYCIGCSACDNVCPIKAIDTSEERHIISDECVSCGQCISHFANGCLRANKHKTAR